MKKVRNDFIMAGIVLIISIIFTILVATVDVQPSSVSGSDLGFSTLNRSVFNSIGTNDAIYLATEILGYIFILPAAVFAVLGIIQLIKRKSLKKVDLHYWALLGLYIAVAATYVFFELVKLPPCFDRRQGGGVISVLAYNACDNRSSLVLFDGLPTC